MKKAVIQYGTREIVFTYEFKERKNLGIKVHPDNTVHVVAPKNTSIETIKDKVKSKAAWIMNQQNFFISFHPMTPARKYVSGESHLYLGKQYRLRLKESKNKSVKLISGYITITTKDINNTKAVKSQLEAWYKQNAIHHFNSLFEKRLEHFSNFNEHTPALKYRWMKKRWGSCDQKGTVLLNLELIKAPKKCIEYVIVHELCHLIYWSHSKNFYQLLEKMYPTWKETKFQLEKLMV